MTDFPSAKRRWQITRGVRATWSPDGRRLAFVDSEMSLSVIDVRPDGVDFEWGEGKRLFRLGDGFAENAGDRYLSRRWSVHSRRASSTLDLLLNWQQIAGRE